MMMSLRIAATGMGAQQTNVDVLANNIANLNTTAFKRQVAAFQDLFYQTKTGAGSVTSSAGTVSPTGLQIGLGSRIASTYSVNTTGNMIETGSPFDMGIQGRGYFEVSFPDGSTKYTRDGSFQIDDAGQIVTKEGYTVNPSITLPTGATEFSIAPNGQVSARVDDTTVNLGEITVAMFVNEAGLNNEGANYYSETDASGTPSTVTPGETGSGTLLQGFIEGSNVDPIESVTQLITAQRAYELNSRVISTADEMLGAINQLN